MQAYTVKRFGETDFKITTPDRGAEFFELYRRSRRTGDYLIVSGRKLWTERGHKKLARLGLFEFGSGRPAQRVDTFFAEADADTNRATSNADSCHRDSR